VEEKIYSISEITRLLKKSLEDNPRFSGIWIRGEISNITYHSSGHIYFTLKDEGAVISAVFFRYANKNLSFRLEEGMSILASGSITVFEKRGSYQFSVAQVRLEGLGELLKKIEQLRKKLLAEGIFDPDHKRPLPFLPARLGVVTSPTGAAVRDIIKVAMRRFPNLEIIVAPASVQGSDAAVSIARGIAELNKPGWNIDVIICGRGGGSFEDLMPFNDEMVVRAFYNSKVPIISAVGHQIDHPLSDEAADYAAPTPSAAAEIAVPIKKELSEEIDYLLSRARGALITRARELRAALQGVCALRVFRNPREMINTREMLLSDLEGRTLLSMKDLVAAARHRYAALPDMRRAVTAMLREKTLMYNGALGAVQKLSPLGILRRGYSIVRDANGGIIKSILSVKAGSSINVMVHDGFMDCRVNSIKNEVPFGKKGVFKNET
jgi:exodeoxyribonuclease VII large subunit